jgi:tetratricopeptide (TPR) repeat protein
MKRSTLVAAALLSASVFGVARLQPRLARTVHSVKEGDEVYAFPPPAELRLSTLGWDAAAVDLLWAKLLVEYGIHWAEHREFHDVPKYVDAILELEAAYEPVYRYVDTMLAYRPLQGTEDDIRKARAYLERGTRERPQDARLWMRYGQFLAFIAPSFLHTDGDRDAWRKAGATAIGRAVELGADAEGALTAASILTRSGETQAAIRYLERAYALTPATSDVHESIGRRLAMLEVMARRDATDEAARAIRDRWQENLPFVTRDQYVLLGPKVDVLRCTGLEAAEDGSCARHWSDALSSSRSSRSEGSP